MEELTNKNEFILAIQFDLAICSESLQVRLDLVAASASSSLASL